MPAAGSSSGHTRCCTLFRGRVRIALLGFLLNNINSYRSASSAFSDSSLRKLVANGQNADAHFSEAYCRRRTVTVVTVAIPASAVDKELGGAAADHDHLNGQGFTP